MAVVIEAKRVESDETIGQRIWRWMKWLGIAAAVLLLLIALAALGALPVAGIVALCGGAFGKAMLIGTGINLLGGVVSGSVSYYRAQKAEYASVK